MKNRDWGFDTFEPMRKKQRDSPKYKLGINRKGGPKSNSVGRKTEKRFKKIIEKMIDGGQDWIILIQKVPSSVDIHEHYDFTVVFRYQETEKSVCVQVKSSIFGANRFKQKHPKIPVIVAGASFSDEQVEEQLRKLYESTFEI